MPTKKATTKKTTTKKAVSKKTTKTAAKSTARKAPAKRAAAKKVTTKKAITRKATKDVAVKKPGGKKTTPRKVAIKKPVKDLIYASDQESFWVQNGEILNSLLALRDALAKMDKDIYQFHAAGEQNDFSLWVDTVLQEPELATDLTKAKTPRTAKNAVVRYLKFYSI